MPDLTDQLFDVLEDLLIENRALVGALSIAKQFLPLPAQARVDECVSQIVSDARIHGEIRDKLAQYRNQSLERTLEELKKKNWKD